MVHITDGESQDGDPIPYADAVKALATEDGNVLLFNCHLSMTAADPFMFPGQRPGPARRAGPGAVPHVERAARAVLPARGRRKVSRLQPSARGMAFNADMVCLIQFLNMGTQAAPGLR